MRTPMALPLRRTQGTPTVSDIRDRITAVLLSPAGLEGSGYTPGTLGHHRRLDEAHRLADVLIRELGLTRFDAPPEYWYATTI